MSEEHYRALGIPPDASKAEIRAAYKQRVKETHPDLNDDPNAAAEFQRVKEARDALLGSGAAGAASAGGSGRSGTGSSGTGASGASSAGSSASRGSSSQGRTETSSGRGADSRDSRRATDSDDGDPRTNYSTRTEEPSGDYANDYGGAAGSSGRRSGSSGTGDRTRTDRSETASGSSGRQRGTGGSARSDTAGDTSGRGQDATAGAGRTQDYVRFRSVIEEPSGNRAASYDRVVSDKYAPTRPSPETDEDVSSGLTMLPAFLVVLVKQYLYSLKWALLGIPLTVVYLWGLRGLYFGGIQASMLSVLLGAVGVSLVKVRLGVNFTGTATFPLVYYALVWHSNPSLLEVAIAFHLVPLFVITALISEYK